MAPQSLSLHLSGDPDLVETRERMRAWLTEVGVDDGERDDIVLACWEAAANAIEHPLAPEDDQAEVHVYAQEQDGHVVVRVSDNGRWRERRASNVREGRGLGLTLIRALMDKVQISTTQSGTSILMSRAISADGH